MAIRPDEHQHDVPLPDELPEDEFTSRLIELAEALAGETNVSADDPTPDDPLSATLRSARACLERIERFRAHERHSPFVDDDRIKFSSAPLDPDAPPQRVGRFEIVRELGRGGYGVVFLARDPGLDRVVALKVPRPEVMLSAELRQRFLREAKAAAALSHANIVPVFETGSVGPIAYIASAFCPGTSLARWLATERQPVSPTSAARIMATLAEAVQHAHGRGVLHRDLKPSNILLERCADASPVADDGIFPDDGDTERTLEDFSPLISDFGLAKIVDTSPLQTRTAAILGTPAYMAPEQAAGRSNEIGPAADIYALGAILYELLVRKPPLSKATDLATLQAVQVEEPMSPKRLRSDVPRDLEAICLKCLEKQPARRYATATALADDLNRFLAGRPVEAQSIGNVERLARWCRRNPLVAGLTMTAGVLLLTVAVISSVAAWRLSRAQAASQQNLDRALEAEQAATQLGTVAERRLFDALVAQAESARHSGRPGQRFDSIKAIREAMELGIPLDDEERLALRNDVIASLSLVDLEVDRIWPLSRTGVRHGLAFDPLVRRFARYRSGDVEVCDIADGQPIQMVARLGNRTFLPQFRFGPRGKHLAAKCTSMGSTTIQVWSLAESETVMSAPCGGEWYLSDFDFSPDGTSIALCAPDRQIVCYDLESGVESFRHQVATPANSLRFHPRLPVICAGLNGQIVLLDVTSGDVRLRFDTAVAVPQVAFHPNGRVLAVGDRHGLVLLFDTTNGKLLRTLSGHTSDIVHADFNPDGTLLATTSWDTTTRLWDPLTGEPLLVAEMTCHSFSRDNAWLGIGCVGTVAGRWKLAAPLEYQRLHVGDLASRVYSLDVAPDGRLIAAGCSQQILIWSTAPGTSRCELATMSRPPHVAFDESGANLISSDATGTYRWSVHQTEESTELGVTTSLIHVDRPERLIRDLPAGQGAPNAHLFARGLDVRCSAGDGIVEIVDRENGRTMATFLGHAGVNSVAISLDRAWAATSTSRGRDVVLWHVDSGEPVKRIPTGRADVAFSPDGGRLAVGTDSEYFVLQIPSCDEQFRLERRTSGKLAPQMAFSADGSLLALTDDPWVVRLLDADDGHEVATLTSPATDIISALSFQSAGQVLAAGTESGTVHRWDVGLMRSHLAEMGLDWEPSLALPSARPVAARTVRFDVPDVSPLGALHALVVGDREGYVRSCMFLQGISPARLSRDALAETVLTLTTAEWDMTSWDSLTTFLEDELAKSPFHHDLVVPLMAIRHRSGDLVETVQLASRERLIYGRAINEPSVSHWVKGLRVLALAHLSMAEQKLGQADDAQQHLAAAEALYDEVQAIQATGDYLKSDLPPERNLEAESLIAEAHQMIDRAE